EADEEVGVVYFGERYLIPRLGRWASPDPLHVHALGGGEALNSYHYVAGSLVQSRDPLGLDLEVVRFDRGFGRTRVAGTSGPIPTLVDRVQVRHRVTDEDANARVREMRQGIADYYRARVDAVRSDTGLSAEQRRDAIV